MVRKALNFLDLLVFMVTPEDSTDRYPDLMFKTSDPALLYLPRYQHVIKTLFWVAASAAFSIMISRLQ